MDDAIPTERPEYQRRAPEATLEAIARSLHKEGLSYGFSKLDFVRLVNLLLDVAIKQEEKAKLAPMELVTRRRKPVGAGSRLTGLPCAEGRVKLRPLDLPADRRLLDTWLADPYGRYFLLSCATARSHNCDELLADSGGQMAIIALADDSPIGAVAFLNHDPTQRRAELRKLIGEPAFRGRGFAKEATRLWLRYGFEVLDLRKIYLDTLDTNLRNIRLNESLGFVVEGILRNEIVLDGKECDVLRMGLCCPH